MCVIIENTKLFCSVPRDAEASVQVGRKLMANGPCLLGLQILGGVMTLALGGAGLYFGMCIDIAMHMPFAL